MDAGNKKRVKSISSTCDDPASEEVASKEASDVNGDEMNDETTLGLEDSVTEAAENNSAGEESKVEKTEGSVGDKSKAKKRKAGEAKTENESASEDSVSDIKESHQDVSKTEKDDSSANESSSDLNMPPKQTLGKGKRARIPNKRYSDILLSPQSRSHKSSVENGEKYEKYEKIEPENDIFNTKDDEIASLPNITSLKSRSNTSSPASKRPKLTTDVTDPKYLKPFLLGWRRELVYRATTDNSNKRNGDIYYYTPAGKKVRSMREVSENLKSKDLTLENFTFFKEPLGLDPDKEIIRDAKAWPKKGTGKSGSRTPKVLSPKISSPKVSSVAKPTPTKVASPKAAPTPPETPAEPSPAPTRARSTRNLGNIKVKLPPSKSKAEKKPKVEEEPMEVESPPAKRTPAKKAPAKATPKTVESPRAKRRSVRSNNTVSNDKHEEPKSMDSYLQNLSYGYNTLLYVFQYLKVQDLLRAGCVCTMWRDIASHPLLWRTVRMKNSQVYSFEGLANSLRKYGTVHLDLRKMLLPTNGDDIWPEFSKSIQKVQTLRKIELCRCPASVVEQLAVTNTDLEVINAVTIKCESMSLDMLSSLKNLKELRLKSTSGLTLSSDITSLKELTSLTHLSLTSIKDLNKMNLNVIAALKRLESLDLGECSDFPANFGEDILTKLKSLEKLRLEKGQGNCHTFEILDAVKQMPHLEQLELVNFDIKSGFDVALGGCRNIRKLLIIPTYISQSATTNHMVLGGVLRLQSTLSHFVWGVTLELLRVTELFVDQCEDPDKADKKVKKLVGNGDSIPVLKPVPLITDKNDTIPPAHDPPQVEILPLPNLQKLLLQSLPTTRVKILKIPFHATWRQSITDTVN